MKISRSIFLAGLVCALGSELHCAEQFEVLERLIKLPSTDELMERLESRGVAYLKDGNQVFFRDFLTDRILPIWHVVLLVEGAIANWHMIHLDAFPALVEERRSKLYGAVFGKKNSPYLAPVSTLMRQFKGQN